MTRSAFTIRPATPADHDFVHSHSARLAEPAVVEGYSRQDFAEFQQSFLKECLADQEATLLIAESLSGAPIGFLQVRPIADGTTGQPAGYITLLSTDPAWEGRGVARGLMQAAEAMAQEQGWYSLALDVFASNGKARTFYAKAGFTPETLRLVKRMSAP